LPQGLLAHACVTQAVNFCPMGPKLRHTGVLYSSCDPSVCCLLARAVGWTTYATESDASADSCVGIAVPDGSVEVRRVDVPGNALPQVAALRLRTSLPHGTGTRTFGRTVVFRVFIVTMHWCDFIVAFVCVVSFLRQSLRNLWQIGSERCDLCSGMCAMSSCAVQSLQSLSSTLFGLCVESREEDVIKLAILVYEHWHGQGWKVSAVSLPASLSAQDGHQLFSRLLYIPSLNVILVATNFGDVPVVSLGVVRGCSLVCA
jgi:hypothetical protein